MQKDVKSWRIGLSGGVGCGKSFVRKLFEAEGFRGLDTDQLARETLETNIDVLEAVKDHFGPAICRPDGAIDRKQLGQIVFNDAEELAWLEGQLHPRVRQLWLGRMEEAADCHWVVEIPLLFEKNLEKHFDMSLCVSCSTQTQMQRLLLRGYTHSDATARISRQMALSEKRQRASFVISNDGDGVFTHSQVLKLIHQLD